MIMATTNVVPGREIAEVLGLVRGTTIRARHLGKDILAGLRNLAGGEVIEYTKMLAEAREEALDRLKYEAHTLGADAIIGIRFQTSMIMRGAAEMLCYGTAVRLVDERAP